MSLLSRMIEPKQMIRDEQKLFTDSMLKAMIIPLVTEQLLQMVVGLADTMMVSYAGEAVVAGVGLDTMIYTIFIYLFTAISAGGSVVVAQYLGSKNRENSNLSASRCNIYTSNRTLSSTCSVISCRFSHLKLPPS